MANPNPSFVLLLLLPLLLPSSMAISESELEAAIAALRLRGYRLFGNAITASDVRYDLLSPVNSSFTLFAPPDALLFSLDMAAPSAAAYVASLRLHVAPGRVSFPDLRSLPDDFPLETLLPGRELIVSSRRSPDADFLTVDGVDIVLPGIYYGNNVAVHGLGGILTLRRPSAVSAAAASPLADPPAPTVAPETAPIASPVAAPDLAPEMPPELPPMVSPAEASAMGLAWDNWACANGETEGCTAASAIGSGWFGRDISGWPRDQDARIEDAL